MIDPMSESVLRRERLSVPALSAVAVIHIGLLWVALQSTQALQVTRKVIYQMLTPTPITRLVEPVPSRAHITPRVAKTERGPISPERVVQASKAVQVPVEKVPEPVPEQVPLKRTLPVVQETVAQLPIPEPIPVPFPPPPPIPVPKP